MEATIITKTVEQVSGYSFEVRPHSWQREHDSPVDYRYPLDVSGLCLNERVYFGFYLDGRDHTIPVPLQIAKELFKTDGNTKFRITVEIVS